MVGNTRRIVWDNAAKEYLKKSILHIGSVSPQNAAMVKDAIRSGVEELRAHPGRYPVDKYKSNNDGSFRAFELYRFRISYFVGDTEVRIVRIRHASQEPLLY